MNDIYYVRFMFRCNTFTETQTSTALQGLTGKAWVLEPRSFLLSLNTLVTPLTEHTVFYCGGNIEVYNALCREWLFLDLETLCVT
jgi:hypothetical protein